MTPKDKSMTTEDYFQELLNDAGREITMPWQSIARLMFVYAKDQETALSAAQEELQRRRIGPSGCACKIDEAGETVLEYCLVHAAAEARIKEQEAAPSTTAVRPWTPKEARRLQDFHDAAILEDLDAAYNAIYWLVSDRAADPYRPWDEVEAAAALNPKDKGGKE